MRTWRGRQAPKSTWLGRWLRGQRPDRNPLRRGSDRAETAMLGVLLAMFLAGVPFAVHLAGNWTYAGSVRQQQVDRATLHQVPATLLQAIPDPPGYANMPGTAPVVKARWKAPDGQVRTGELYVPGGAKVGSTITVWVNQAGQLTDPPLQSYQVASRADLNETLAVATLAAALILVAWLGRWALDKRRLAAWDADWLATGPRWSPQR
jgi:hypothetical protein